MNLLRDQLRLAEAKLQEHVSAARAINQEAQNNLQKSDREVVLLTGQLEHSKAKIAEIESFQKKLQKSDRTIVILREQLGGSEERMAELLAERKQMDDEMRRVKNVLAEKDTELEIMEQRSKEMLRTHGLEIQRLQVQQDGEKLLMLKQTQKMEQVSKRCA